MYIFNKAFGNEKNAECQFSHFFAQFDVNFNHVTMTSRFMYKTLRV